MNDQEKQGAWQVLVRLWNSAAPTTRQEFESLLRNVADLYEVPQPDEEEEEGARGTMLSVSYENGKAKVFADGVQLGNIISVKVSIEPGQQREHWQIDVGSHRNVETEVDMIRKALSGASHNVRVVPTTLRDP